MKCKPARLSKLRLGSFYQQFCTHAHVFTSILCVCACVHKYTSALCVCACVHKYTSALCVCACVHKYTSTLCVIACVHRFFVRMCVYTSTLCEHLHARTCICLLYCEAQILMPVAVAQLLVVVLHRTPPIMLEHTHTRTHTQKTQTPPKFVCALL
jgi:hypothetical protein